MGPDPHARLLERKAAARPRLSAPEGDSASQRHPQAPQRRETHRRQARAGHGPVLGHSRVHGPCVLGCHNCRGRDAGHALLVVRQADGHARGLQGGDHRRCVHGGCWSGRGEPPEPRGAGAQHGAGHDLGGGESEPAGRAEPADPPGGSHGAGLRRGRRLQAAEVLPVWGHRQRGEPDGVHELPAVHPPERRHAGVLRAAGGGRGRAPVPGPRHAQHQGEGGDAHVAGLRRAVGRRGCAPRGRCLRGRGRREGGLALGRVRLERRLNARALRLADAELARRRAAHRRCLSGLVTDVERVGLEDPGGRCRDAPVRRSLTTSAGAREGRLAIERAMAAAGRFHGEDRESKTGSYRLSVCIIL
mmetsp:Transcript_41554/g.98490  ORF Transcript_41554/g.98490 Transcript_41554/m.98490 type:complete len:360 (+) Transcript_41554:1130-2209(+)